MSALRKTGIDVVEDIPWGSHFCYFYQTTHDLLDTLVPYFITGLKNREFCLWVISNSELLTLEEATEALGRALPDLERYLAEGSIEIVNHDDWFLNGGTFDHHRVANRFKEKLDEALARGYAGMRLNGSPAWIQKENRIWFCEFEEEINRLFHKERIIASCTFPLATIKGDEIFDITQAHQFAIAKRYGQWEVIETPELKQAKAKIKKLNESLEKRIVERTRKLRYEIAERKKAEEELEQINEELRSLSAHLQTVREEERIQIARNIHDDLGQQLTGLKMDVNWLNKKLVAEDEIIKQKLISMIELIDETLKSVRRISSNLRPGILDDFGLIAALEWHSEEVAKRSGIKVNFITDMAGPDIPVAVATGIFRIYQELLTNAVRHANAHVITSSLRLKHNQLTLKVKDDGRGIDPKITGTKKTLGLIGIKERIFALGGKYDLKSKPGKGTEIQVSVPFHNSMNKA